MPGVADAVRATQESQDQKKRKAEREELLRMVREGRTHECTEQQLENLKLMLDLQKAFGGDSEPIVAEVGTEFVAAVKQAVTEALANMPTRIVSPDGSVIDSSRPSMKHMSTDLLQKDEGFSISNEGDLVKEETVLDDAAEKREKLRKLRGTKK